MKSFASFPIIGRAYEKIMTNDTLLWQVRYFVYSHFTETTNPPSVDETAHHFNISTEEAKLLYRELNNRHAFFLEPETLTIRMANPFSGIPSDFRVHANGRTYFANCAWDMLGIPAAIHCDAVIDAVCTESNETVQLDIRNGKVTESDLLIHFPLPFTRWYDDLIFT
jgi:hypothetical protein